MHMSECLERISAIYPSGCIGYYSRCKPDPWQAAHDKLEGYVGSSVEDFERACDQFFYEIEMLIRNYKNMMARMNGQQKPEKKSEPIVDVADAFHSISAAVAVAKVSARARRCAKCGTDADLRLTKVSGVLTPVCGKCKTLPQGEQLGMFG